MVRPDDMPQLMSILQRLRAVRDARAKFLRRWARRSSSQLARQLLMETATAKVHGRADDELLLDRKLDRDDQ